MRTGRCSLTSKILFTAIATLTMFFSTAAIAGSNIVVIEDYNGVLTNLHPKDDFTALINMQNATNAFYMQEGIEDDFDFLFVFLKGTANLLSHADAAPRGFTAQQAGQGTGAPSPDSTPANFGSAGKLKLVGDMFIVDAFPSNPESYYVPMGNPLLGEGYPQAVFTGVEWLGRVAGRYWMSYATYGSDKGDLLDNPSDPKHWSFFFSNGGSVMGGNKYRDDGSNRWMIMDQEKMYTTLDQYLMGMIGPEEVLADENIEYFTITPTESDYKRTDLPADGGGFMKGTRGDTITIESIISSNGALNPDNTQSQKDFRCAFILVIPPGTGAAPIDVDKLDLLRNKFELWFNQNTSVKGFMDCTLDGSGVDGDEDGDGSTDGDDGPTECVPDSKRCSGDVVEQCDTNHNWGFFKNCASDDMTCKGGECVSEGCTETEGGASSCSGTCCDPTFTSCRSSSLCTCNFDAGTGEGTYLSHNCNNVCTEAGKEFDRCGQPEEGAADACICEGGVVNPDGDESPTDGDSTVEGECSPETVFYDCETNFRCLANACSPCPEGTERVGELNFCSEAEGGDEDSSAGGCSASAGAGLWFALLGLAAFRRRISN